MSTPIARPCHTQFTPEDWELLASHWHPVALSEEIASKPVAVQLLDVALVVYRVNQEVVVARDVCPHRGVPLSMGHVEKDGLVCPYHGIRFGEKGRCNRIPASPSQNIPNKMHLQTVKVAEHYGLVWVCLRPNETTPQSIPVFPEWNDEGYQRINCPGFDIEAFAGRQIEGFIDVAHFAWVHEATFADSSNDTVPDYSTKETNSGFEAHYVSSVANYTKDSDIESPAGFEWLRHFEVQVPFTAKLTVHFPAGGRLSILNVASPVSTTKTRLFVPIAKNFDKHIPVQDIKAFNLRVFEEDRALVERQTPQNLPTDLSLEAHIPADRSSIAYRRSLQKHGFGIFFNI